MARRKAPRKSPFTASPLTVPVNVAPQSSASASYTNGYQPKDNAKKVIDGQVVYANTPNETWNNWGDSTGVEPWLQLKWAGKVPLKKAKVFFWTDGGGVPMVSSWKLSTLTLTVTGRM